MLERGRGGRRRWGVSLRRRLVLYFSGISLVNPYMHLYIQISWVCKQSSTLVALCLKAHPFLGACLRARPALTLATNGLDSRQCRRNSAIVHHVPRRYFLLTLRINNLILPPNSDRLQYHLSTLIPPPGLAARRFHMLSTIADGNPGHPVLRGLTAIRGPQGF
jgi:hypothetical protein